MDITCRARVSPGAECTSFETQLYFAIHSSPVEGDFNEELDLLLDSWQNADGEPSMVLQDSELESLRARILVSLYHVHHAFRLHVGPWEDMADAARNVSVLLVGQLEHHLIFHVNIVFKHLLVVCHGTQTTKDVLSQVNSGNCDY